MANLPNSMSAALLDNAGRFHQANKGVAQMSKQDR